jgi:predicted DNA-binding transcriptional regulator AlpA
VEFTYLDLTQVLTNSYCRSKPFLYTEIRAGRFPKADRISGRSLWRSNLVEEANKAYAARAATARAALEGSRRKRAQEMLKASVEAKARRPRTAAQAA